MPLFGTKPTGRTLAPQLKISDLHVMAEQFLVNPQLPSLGQDPFSYPSQDDIVIARGRLLGVLNTMTSSLPAYAQTEKTYLTVANGSQGLTNSSGIPSDVKAIGFSSTHWFRTYSEQVQPFPSISRGELVSLPYVGTSNGAYGNINQGDRVTAYYGTANSNPVLASEVGKVVKWVPNTLFTQHSTGAAVTIVLSQAVLPAFRPTAVMAWCTGSVVPVTSASYSYANNVWSVTLNAAVTDVLYTYGQYADNIAGEVVSFKAVGTAGGELSTPNQFPGWLQWVRDRQEAWPLPPQNTPHPYVSIINETPTTIGNNQYRLAQFPIVPTRTIAVYVTGTRVDPFTGVATTLTGTTPLPLMDALFIQDYTYGQDYQINPLTGVITLFDNFTSISAVTVSYSANSSYLDGKIYDPGIINQTDGRYSGVPGTPANLEMPGVLADMHVALFAD